MVWLDKIIMYIICSFFYLSFQYSEYAPGVMCVGMIFTCLHFVLKNQWAQLALLYGYGVLVLVQPEFLFFLPLIVYDNFYKMKKYHVLVLLIPVLYYFDISKEYFSVIVSTLLGLVLKHKTLHLLDMKKKFIQTRDDGEEYNRILKEKNEQLIEKQDYEIHLAALSERDRISKELHDSIGHTLSRALLQVGALQVVSEEEKITLGLEQLKKSLTYGMDSVKETVHNMRDESFDLQSKFRGIIDDFYFCKIVFEYEVEISPPMEIKYLFVFTLQEVLVNAAKHSNATEILIRIMEQPGMYQFVYKDNGKLSKQKKEKISKHLDENIYSKGMGISGMKERTIRAGGTFYLSTEKGLKIYITIKKETRG